LFDIQIENHGLHFRERAKSKCGSLDFINHKPGGGDTKVLCGLIFVTKIVFGFCLDFSILRAVYVINDNVSALRSVYRIQQPNC